MKTFIALFALIALSSAVSMSYHGSIVYVDDLINTYVDYRTNETNVKGFAHNFNWTFYSDNF